MKQDERASLFEKLSDVDQDGCQKLPSAQIVKGVLCVAKAQAREHAAYQHYTSLEAFRKIFNPHHPGLRLSRIDDDKLNDQNEMRKYGAGIPNAFIGCFSHASAESASLWWLYTRGKRMAMRITFPKETFRRWCQAASTPASRKQWKALQIDGCGLPTPIAWFRPLITDVVYLAVKGVCDEYQQARKNVMSWEDQRVGVEGLWKMAYRKDRLGIFKDYEWKDERETRIIVQMKRFDKRINYVCLPFDRATISHLRITTSPWATPADVEKMRKAAIKLLSPFGWKPTKQNFRISVLSGALKAIAK